MTYSRWWSITLSDTWVCGMAAGRCDRVASIQKICGHDGVHGAHNLQLIHQGVLNTMRLYQQLQLLWNTRTRTKMLIMPSINITLTFAHKKKKNCLMVNLRSHFHLNLKVHQYSLNQSTMLGILNVWLFIDNIYLLFFLTFSVVKMDILEGCSRMAFTVTITSHSLNWYWWWLVVPSCAPLSAGVILEADAKHSFLLVSLGLYAVLSISSLLDIWYLRLLWPIFS